MDTADVEMLQHRAAQQSGGHGAGAAARPLPLRQLRLYSQSQAGQALQALLCVSEWRLSYALTRTTPRGACWVLGLRVADCHCQGGKASRSDHVTANTAAGGPWSTARTRRKGGNRSAADRTQREYMTSAFSLPRHRAQDACAPSACSWAGRSFSHRVSLASMTQVAPLKGCGGSASGCGGGEDTVLERAPQ